MVDILDCRAEAVMVVEHIVQVVGKVGVAYHKLELVHTVDIDLE